MHRRVAAVVPAAASGLFGALFFATIAGKEVLDPRQVRWVFQGDWQWHFLGWHFFRNEPWRLPPGVLTTYMEPVGSAIGYTDSIPLAALLLKPAAMLLPNPLQYLGAWLLACFILQGAIGSVLIGAWTRDPVVRCLGGCLLVLTPALMSRVMHPALCAHWILLWALWIALREPLLSRRHASLHYLLVSLVSGLLHPYLAVTVLVILLAAAAKRIAGRALPASLDGLALFGAGATSVGVGWWASGLLTFTSQQNVETEGWGRFSTNLLAIVNPGPWSRFVPALPWFAPEQSHEGFHYFGVAVLALCVVAAVQASKASGFFRVSSIPLTVALAALALVSLSPRVTFGDRTIINLLPYVGESTTFRASARFFWPVTYAIVSSAIGVVSTSLRRGVAVGLVAGATALQMFELQPLYSAFYAGFRNPVFLGANLPTPSDEWHRLLPNFSRIRMYWPQLCGGPLAMPMPLAAYLAGLHGLGLNDGFAARIDAVRMTAACQRLEHEFASGTINDDTVYLVAQPFLDAFQKQARVRCRPIDDVPVCLSNTAVERLSLKW